jgi:cytoskeleton protein RodZ
MLDNTVTEEKHEFLLGPGEKLRQTRESQGLTLEDVAHKLFLSRQRLVDIERDDYSRVNSFIYIKGYLRNYAKLIGLDVDDIINRFNKLGLQEEWPRGNTEIVVQHQGKVKMKKRRRGILWLDIIMVFAIILLAGLWWFTRSITKDEPAPPKQVIQQMVVPPT